MLDYNDILQWSIVPKFFWSVAPFEYKMRLSLIIHVSEVNSICTYISYIKENGYEIDFDVFKMGVFVKILNRKFNISILQQSKVRAIKNHVL